MGGFYTQIQGALLNAINRPDFSAALPPLSDEAWEKILGVSQQSLGKMDTERLEFLGDALMWSTLGHQLYIQLPDGTPHMYTECRAALHSNMTFSCLAEKLDIMCVSSRVLSALTRRTFGEGQAAPVKSRPEMKATADLFEIVIGAYYQESGFEKLCQWVNEMYLPLINVAKDTYLENLHNERRKRPGGYREQSPPHHKRAILESPRRNVIYGPRIGRLEKRIITPSKVRRISAGTIFTNAPVTPKKKAVPSITKKRPTSSPALAPTATRLRTPVIIDLTGVDDSDEDDNAVVDLIAPVANSRPSSPSEFYNASQATSPFDESSGDDQELKTLLIEESLTENDNDPYGEQDMDISMDLDTDSDSSSTRGMILCYESIGDVGSDPGRKNLITSRPLYMEGPDLGDEDLDADATLVVYD